MMVGRSHVHVERILLQTRPSAMENFWKVSGFVAGFVVTVLCLSRRTVLHTLHARMFSALIEFCTSHLK